MILLSSPFDLHVLGTPPAFILSQDQTLRIFIRIHLFDGLSSSLLLLLLLFSLISWDPFTVSIQLSRFCFSMFSPVPRLCPIKNPSVLHWVLLRLLAPPLPIPVSRRVFYLTASPSLLSRVLLSSSCSLFQGPARCPPLSPRK